MLNVASAEDLLPCLSDDLPGVAREDVAVREDHTLEVPCQDARHAPAHSRLVAPGEPVLGGRAGSVPHAERAKNDPEEQVGAGRGRRKVLDQVDEDEGAAGAVKEGDLAHEARPPVSYTHLRAHET